MPHDIPWWRRPGVHLRHDAHRWIRHDAARFVRPGFDPADVFPTLARKTQPVQAPTLDDELAADIAAARRDLRAIQDEVNEVNAEMARWRGPDAKYSPTQPRVPAGNPRGGQWTDRSGGLGTVAGPSRDTRPGTGPMLAQPMGNVDVGNLSGSSELLGLFNIGPAGTGSNSANSSDAVLKVATDDSGRRYSVNLQEEEARGGHTLRDHVGKTDAYLIGLMNADYERSTSGNLEITRFRDAEGSFATPEQANDYVNQLLKLERDKVDQVAIGAEKWLKLESRIGSVTGYEAFRPNGDSDPYIRDTYGVRAVIIHDSRSPRGYTVRTAFPVNQRRGGR
jgi:hypothetical protein